MYFRIQITGWSNIYLLNCATSNRWCTRWGWSSDKYKSILLPTSRHGVTNCCMLTKSLMISIIPYSRWCEYLSGACWVIMCYVIITAGSLSWFVLTLFTTMMLVTALVTPKWLIGPQNYQQHEYNMTFVRHPSVGINTR